MSLQTIGRILFRLPKKFLKILTFVGNPKKHKVKIPTAFLPDKVESRRVHCMFLHYHYLTLLSFVPKKKRG